eukprot:3213710-Rhodomonas_salina.3
MSKQGIGAKELISLKQQTVWRMGTAPAKLASQGPKTSRRVRSIICKEDLHLRWMCKTLGTRPCRR